MGLNFPHLSGEAAFVYGADLIKQNTRRFANTFYFWGATKRLLLTDQRHDNNARQRGIQNRGGIFTLLCTAFRGRSKAECAFRSILRRRLGAQRVAGETI